MFGDDLVIRTLLTPPRLPRNWLRRPRLDQLLATMAEFPLTIVSASAGYGKSSGLASFAVRGGWPTIWYSLHEGSSDPLIFLVHLINACRVLLPDAGTRALALLEQSGAHGQQALDSLMNDLAAGLDDETLLILDDYHLVDESPPVRELIERLLQFCPAQLHLVLTTRHWPQLAMLPTLRARGELYEIGEEQLAFSRDEIGELFASVYHFALDDDETEALDQSTGGWAIALQLLSQRLADQQRDGIAGVPTIEHDSLFAYLAHDVFARQPEPIQSFLLASSVLDELDAGACDAVLERNDSAKLLRMIERRGLFLTLQDGRYRYHPLFCEFLQHEAANKGDWSALHRRAAAYYHSQDAGDHALRHLLAAGDTAEVVRELDSIAQEWLDGGRALPLLQWIEQLPPSALVAHPHLLLAQGDAARLLARFDDALRAYGDAEAQYEQQDDRVGRARALQGKAQVFLDTVQPIRADDLLRRAFRLLPSDEHTERASIARLLAENRLNSGRAAQAERLYRFADRLACQQHAPDPRVLLRLGRLADAHKQLDTLMAVGVARNGQAGSAHREASLLRSFIAALEGDVDTAQRSAQRGLDDARERGSALAEAVAHMRLGHALQLGHHPDLLAANAHYLQAINLADSFAVQRTKAEAYLGLALLHGFATSLSAAQEAAHAGLMIAEQSGDAWTAALLWLALGAVGAARGAPDVLQWLAAAHDRFALAGDAYGQTLVSLWTAIWHERVGQNDAAAQHALAMLERCAAGGYDALFLAPTLFGPRDRMMLVPVLLAGRADARWGALANRLLAQGFPAIAADDATGDYHPGVGLRISLFDRLRVLRGGDEIEPRAWQRKKAQQLLALLLTNRGRWLQRDQICELLWPEATSAEAQTQFKVTLNALNAALEPTRPPRHPAFYVRRQDSAYRFCPPDGVWIDVDAFEDRLTAARTALANGQNEAAHSALLAAVALYENDYLSEYLYEDWARAERERLALRYLEAATTLAELLLDRGQLDEATQLCEVVLARDAGWESAYSLLMRAYAQGGNRRLVVASYERCVRNLRASLDVAPLPQTTELYHRLLHQN